MFLLQSRRVAALLSPHVASIPYVCLSATIPSCANKKAGKSINSLGPLALVAFLSLAYRIPGLL
jgi:hypothetical protein